MNILIKTLHAYYNTLVLRLIGGLSLYAKKGNGDQYRLPPILQRQCFKYFGPMHVATPMWYCIYWSRKNETRFSKHNAKQDGAHAFKITPSLSLIQFKLLTTSTSTAARWNLISPGRDKCSGLSIANSFSLACMRKYRSTTGILAPKSITRRKKSPGSRGATVTVIETKGKTEPKKRQKKKEKEEKSNRTRPNVESYI